MSRKISRARGTRRGSARRVRVTIDGRQRSVPAEDAYFYTPEWQAKEREADKDIAAGRVIGPSLTAEETIAALRRHRSR